MFMFVTVRCCVSACVSLPFSYFVKGRIIRQQALCKNYGTYGSKQNNVKKTCPCTRCTLQSLYVTAMIYMCMSNAFCPKTTATVNWRLAASITVSASFLCFIWIIFAVLLFLERNGWFVLFGIIAVIFIWSKLKPHWRKWKEKRDQKMEEERIGKRSSLWSNAYINLMFNYEIVNNKSSTIQIICTKAVITHSDNT